MPGNPNNHTDINVNEWMDDLNNIQKQLKPEGLKSSKKLEKFIKKIKKWQGKQPTCKELLEFEKCFVDWWKAKKNLNPNTKIWELCNNFFQKIQATYLYDERSQAGQVSAEPSVEPDDSEPDDSEPDDSEEKVSIFSDKQEELISILGLLAPVDNKIDINEISFFLAILANSSRYVTNNHTRQKIHQASVDSVANEIDLRNEIFANREAYGNAVKFLKTSFDRLFKHEQTASSKEATAKLYGFINFFLLQKKEALEDSYFQISSVKEIEILRKQLMDKVESYGAQDASFRKSQFIKNGEKLAKEFESPLALLGPQCKYIKELVKKIEDTQSEDIARPRTGSCSGPGPGHIPLAPPVPKSAYSADNKGLATHAKNAEQNSQSASSPQPSIAAVSSPPQRSLTSPPVRREETKGAVPVANVSVPAHQSPSSYKKPGHQKSASVAESTPALVTSGFLSESQTNRQKEGVRKRESLPTSQTSAPELLDFQKRRSIFGGASTSQTSSAYKPNIVPK